MKAVALVLSLSAIVTALLATGCASGGVKQPKNTSKYNYEDTSKFVLFDDRAQHSVTCSGIQEGRTPEGRFKVTANLRNRENRRIEVQANCVFKDVQGFTLDEVPFRTVILDENATEAVTFESFAKDAAKYTIRVRQSR